LVYLLGLVKKYLCLIVLLGAVYAAPVLKADTGGFPGGLSLPPDTVEGGGPNGEGDDPGYPYDPSVDGVCA